MVTRYLRVEPGQLERAAASAARILAKGGLVAFPTDTVYGLAARADDDRAVGLIFQVKRRRDDNPLPILLPGAEAVGHAARCVPDAARKLAAHYWPGPLTIVLPREPRISDLVTAGRDSVGLRVPDHPVALAILERCEFLVAVTSANLAGQPPAREGEEVRRDLAGNIDLIVDAGRCPGGVPSTVVDLTGPHPRVVRPGAVTWAQIQAVLSSP